LLRCNRCQPFHSHAFNTSKFFSRFLQHLGGRIDQYECGVRKYSG
jgi:hypothetical protein